MRRNDSLRLLFFFNDTATTEIYTLSLHDALPIYPQGPAIDGAGNLYVADSGNGTIRRIGPNGVITSLILNGSSAYFGVRSPLLNPSLDYPTAVAVDGSGNLYIAEPAAVLRVAANGALTTIAGTGVTGDSGDGG